MDDPNPDSISEGKASLVLDRAARLEAAGDAHLSVEELRRAALDAGIPLEAFERALAEVRATPDAGDAQELPGGVRVVDALGGARPWRSRLVAWFQRSAIAALGAALAAFSQVLSQGFGIDAAAAVIFSLVMALFFVADLVAKRRRDRAVADFEFDLGALWAGLTLVWMLSEPGDAVGVLGGTLLMGAITALVGGIVVALPPKTSAEERLVDESPLELPDARRS